MLSFSDANGALFSTCSVLRPRSPRTIECAAHSACFYMLDGFAATATLNAITPKTPLAIDAKSMAAAEA